VVLFALLQTTAADRTDTFRFSNAIDGIADNDNANFWSKAGDPAVTVDPPDPKTPEGIWYKAQCRGYKILKAMREEEDVCRVTLGWQYCQSRWEGAPNELTGWGYHVNDELDYEDCEKSIEGLAYAGMKSAFRDLNIDPKSTKNQDPTRCFYVKHYSGKTPRGDDQWYYNPSTHQSYLVCSALPFFAPTYEVLNTRSTPAPVLRSPSTPRTALYTS